MCVSVAKSGKMDLIPPPKRLQNRAPVRLFIRHPRRSCLPFGTADRFMNWYAHQLLRPWVQFVVITAFAALLGLCTWSTCQFQQHFDYTDVIPAGSYVQDFANTIDAYKEVSLIGTGVYFRNVDQSDPLIRAQMRNYIDALLENEYFNRPPDFFWLDHFDLFVAFTGKSHLPFNEQVDLFLQNPVFSLLYRRDIARDEQGNVIASKTRIGVDVDLTDIQDQLAALEAEEAITKAHPMNEGRDEYAFFTYEGMYKLWTFYR